MKSLNLLNEYHTYVDQSYVIDSPGYILGFIEKRFGISYVITDFDSPQKEKKFA